MGSTWKITTTILCIFGFLKELRPSEPYLTEYIIDPRYPNVTLEQVYKDVYPVWTYAYLSVLFLVFLITDFFRYKVIIVIGGCAYVGTWLLLLFTKGVAWMQAMQFMYGVACSTEVAYFSYIYAKVEPSHYQIVTSFTRVALLVGRFCSGVVGQTLVGFDVTTYRGLVFITATAASLSVLVSLFLPKVDKSIYFHRTPGGTSLKKDWKLILKYLRDDAKDAFSNPYVLKWSIWWSIGMAGNFQVGNYIQPLWETIAPDETNAIYNGGVEAFATLMGATFAFVLGYVKIDWSVYGEFLLFFFSHINGGFLILLASTETIWAAYGGYVAFRSLYQMMITVATFEVARNIHEDSYGLVFGINTFFALLWQTILTVVVVDSVGMGLPPRNQFYIYGGYWIYCGALFTISAAVSIITKCQQKTEEPPLTIQNEPNVSEDEA